MKKSVVFLILLVICMPISFASNEKIYVYGGDGLIASKQGDDVMYYNQDFLGSNKIVSDEDGDIISKNVQYPFGEDYSEKGSKEGLDNNYKFTGQEEDEDLYYYGARYYDPSISRFISVDPVFDSSISSYAYVGNNPLKYVDPSGNTLMYSTNYNFQKGGFKGWWGNYKNAVSNANIGRPFDFFNSGLIFQAIGFMDYLDPVGIFGLVNPIGEFSRVSGLKDVNIEKVYSRSIPVGQGGNAHVVRAENLAIKRTRPTDPFGTRITKAEFDLLSEYGGKNYGSFSLPKAYSFGEQKKAGYLIKDFIEGSVVSESKISLERATEFAGDLGRFARREGVHLSDSKGANLVLTSNNELFFIDPIGVPINDVNFVEYTKMDINALSSAVKGGYSERIADMLKIAFYGGFSP